MPFRNLVTSLIRFVEGPFIAAIALLGARIAVGLVFWRSGNTKVDQDFALTDSTFYLFEYEYALPLIPPQFAAYMAAYAELALPLLLWVGLGSRFAAAGLLVMTLVIQTFVYPQSWPEHMLWAGLLGVILTKGPGLFAADHLIRKRFM
ncbi:MAG: DoxX family protein [Alphaproteobacteria bacterium]